MRAAAIDVYIYKLGTRFSVLRMFYVYVAAVYYITHSMSMFTVLGGRHY